MLVTGSVLQPLGDLSRQLKTIYWITWPDDIPIEVHQILPQTIRVLRNSLFALWRSDLGPDPLDENMTVSGIPVHLHRAANSALISPTLLKSMPGSAWPTDSARWKGTAAWTGYGRWVPRQACP